MSMRGEKLEIVSGIYLTISGECHCAVVESAVLRPGGYNAAILIFHWVLCVCVKALDDWCCPRWCQLGRWLYDLEPYVSVKCVNHRNLMLTTCSRKRCNTHICLHSAVLRQVMLCGPGACSALQAHLRAATHLPYFMSLCGNMPRSILTL